jgi:molybdenum cofactor biosynthesis enzyme MoaA
MTFVDEWRRRKSAASDLEANSTARRTVTFDLFGRSVRVYANANLSIYSAQACNAKCPFCVEELRPASRGTARRAKGGRAAMTAFARLEQALETLRPLSPSVSVTGGEPSIDPRLPRILRTLADHGMRKRTMTTNGSGLLDVRAGRLVIDWVTAMGLRHLNISRAHPDHDRNAQLMQLRAGLTLSQLREVVERASAVGTRVRLSCVLLRAETDSLDGVLRYLDFAASLGVDNVIFRQLMLSDPAAAAINSVVRYSDAKRAALEPILDAVSADGRFRFVRQVVGYYYYVEVWRFGRMDVVFEEADLARLEVSKRAEPDLIHELVFHPNARLASTWQLGRCPGVSVGHDPRGNSLFNRPHS